MKLIKRLTLGTLLLTACATASAASPVTESWSNKGMTMVFNLTPNDMTDLWTASKSYLSPQMFFTCYSKDMAETSKYSKTMVEPNSVDLTINDVPLTLDDKNGYKASAPVCTWGKQMHFTAQWNDDKTPSSTIDQTIEVTCVGLY